eukprot:TRINITY_DN1146_c0_g2_i1.p1 TRINITY_DN1146_c0_g2~~TRINITY_DN1146_c0_g2_i1.p1  ORF type:complete len:210 (-),score=38.16 TRINITY_DN1146_c0_g2_i1:122-751(-)
MAVVFAPPPAPVLRPLRVSEDDLAQIEFLELPLAALEFAEMAEPRVLKRQLEEAGQSVSSRLSPPKAPRLAPVPAPDLCDIPFLLLPDAMESDFTERSLSQPFKEDRSRDGYQQATDEVVKTHCLASRRKLNLDKDLVQRLNFEDMKMWMKSEGEFSISADAILAMDNLAKHNRTYSTCSTCPSPSQVGSPWAPKSSEVEAIPTELLLF